MKQMPWLGLMLVLSTWSVAHAQQPAYLEMDVVAEDLTVPWDLVWGPDNHIWCLEKTGRLSRINPDTKESETVYEIPDVYQSWDNSGAHSMILHPNFPLSPYIYVNYTYELYSGRLSRLTFSMDTESVVDTTILIRKLPGNTSHNGSRMVAGPDGHLYLSTGEAFVEHIAQDISSLGGKVLRMDWDGQAVPDNPFGNYVYSLGHRNPQGLVFSPQGLLYSSEHGAGTDDEVNLVEKGVNYGWPQVEGFCDQPDETTPCQELEVKEPLAAWSPTLAPCGLEYFNHGSIPEWQHSLLLVFLKKQQMRVLHLSEDGNSVLSEDVCFEQELGRLRDVLVSPNGRVFLATSNREINGWDFLAQEEDDRIIELRNPTWSYGDDHSPKDLWEVLRDLVLATTSIEDGILTEEGVLYPQPASSSVTMILPEDAERAEVHVYDASGRQVWQQENLTMIEPGLLHLNINHLHNGMYVVRVQTDLGTQFAEPLLVQRR